MNEISRPTDANDEGINISENKNALKIDKRFLDLLDVEKIVKKTGLSEWNYNFKRKT